MNKVDISLVARQYVANGWALVPIPSGTKGPTTNGWNRPENCVTTPAACSRIKDNVGIAHKYSRTCVLDFDDLVKSAAWLQERGLDFDGLWNAPTAVRISSGRPNRGKLLFRLPPGVAALRTFQLPEFGLELRCASSKGMTVQDVLPPSIHPDTGAPYEWDYAEPLLGDWRSPPHLPADVLAVWQGLARAAAEVTASTGQGDVEGARAVLEEFDPSMSYPDWIRIGMALHHEFNGGYEGLDLWDEWSAGGDTYKGMDDLEYHWRTFDNGKEGALHTLDSLRADIRTRPISAEEFDILVADEAPVIPAKTGTVADDFDDMGPAEEVMGRDLSPVPKRRPFELMSASQFMGRPPLQWIIKGLLPKAAIGLIYGASGSGKTFVSLDMALSIARGIDWRGLRTKKGGVAYVVAEGATGFQSRLQAYCQAHGLLPNDLPIHLMDDAPNLSSAKAMAPVCAELLKCGPLSVIFMDTYARVLGDGDENSAKDTALAVANCYHLHRLTGAVVVLVHHTGKDATKGARGNSALRASADVELEVTRTNNYNALTIGKMKDGRDQGEFRFRLNDVTIGVDDDGDAITSCVVEHIGNEPEDDTPEDTGPTLGRVQQRILDQLATYIGGEVERETFIQDVRAITPVDATGKEKANWKVLITTPLRKLIEADRVIEVNGALSLPKTACD